MKRIVAFLLCVLLGVLFVGVTLQPIHTALASSISNGSLFPCTVSGLNVTCPANIITGSTALPAGAPSGTIGSTVFYSPNGRLNLKAFGAIGDGTTDDTAAVQAWSTAITLSAGSPKTGGSGYCPPGTYKLTATVTVSNAFGISVQGANNCIFYWQGASAAIPMFDLQNISNSELSGFKVLADSSKPLAEAFRIQDAGLGIRLRQIKFRTIFIEGTNGFINYGFRGFVGAGGDANGDFMEFDNVRVSNYGIAGWSIEGTQMFSWQMINCQAIGAAGVSKYAVSGGTATATASTFIWTGGFVGNNTVEDFFIGAPSGPGSGYTLNNISSEGSNRWLVTNGPTGAATPITMSSIRWTKASLNADGFVMNINTPGPIYVVNSRFGELVEANAFSTPTKINWTYVGSPSNRPYFAFIASTMVGNLSTVATLFTTNPPNNLFGSTAQTAASTWTDLEPSGPVNGGIITATTSVAAPKILGGVAATGTVGPYAVSIIGETNGAQRADRVGTPTQYGEIFGGGSGQSPGFHAFSAGKGMAFVNESSSTATATLFQQGPTGSVVTVGQFDAVGNFIASLQSQAVGFIGIGGVNAATGCSLSAVTGGLSAGTFTSGVTGTCTVVLSLGGAAPTGWHCSASNRTTANLFRQTASTTTGATISGVTVTGDVISFACIGY